MNIQKIKISEVKMNPNNPRLIKDDKFAKLVKSINEFPKMLEIRPIVVNADMIVLGGNMRLKACKEAGLKEVPVIFAKDLTEEEQKQFIIKDNVGFGEWDWDMIANEWDAEQVEEWGLFIPNFDLQDFFETEDKKNEAAEKPTGSDDDYSVFELIMLHENKLLLIDTLNKVKNNYLFEKQEDALMEILRIYNQK
jgi:hypothetical protein